MSRPIYEGLPTSESTAHAAEQTALRAPTSAATSIEHSDFERDGNLDYDKDEDEDQREFSTTRSRILLAVLSLFLVFISFKAAQNSLYPQTQQLPLPDLPPDQAVPDKPKPSSASSTSTLPLIPLPSPTPTPTPTLTPTPTPPSNCSSDMSCDAKKSVGYFVNWGIYGRKFPPSLIPVNDLTHILYAFANIRADSGEVYLSDLWADQDIHYPGDSWNDVGNNLYGNFKAIYKLKKANRHLKVLLSIGGWTYSPSFHPVVVNPAFRAKFVESSVKLLEDYGLDGLDVDYEYPTDEAQAVGYVELLKEMRAALDKKAAKKGADCKFLLTIAAPCGADNYKKLQIPAMDQYLDFWNLMAYDFSGTWDAIANHQANLYGGKVSASAAVDYYIAQGVRRSKLILGIPLYGRSFLNTNGPGSAFSGTGSGTWEAGVYDYRALPLPNSAVQTDKSAVASWSFDSSKKEMISFDNEEVGKLKGKYIKNENLGGSMFWELSGDKGSSRDGMESGPGKDPQPGKSLVAVVKDNMGALDMSKNWLSYTESKFDNMRKGMD